MKQLLSTAKLRLMFAMSALMSLAFSATAFASETPLNVNDVLTASFTKVASDITGTIGSILPIGLGIIGTVLAITFGIKFFKKIAK